MQQAKLVWFDATSGEGEVELDDGEALYLHFTCIGGVSKNNWQWPTEADQRRMAQLESGTPCQVTVYENLYSRRVEICKFT